MFKLIIVSVFIINFNLRLTNASPRIYLKELDLEDNSNHKDTVSRTELLNRAINLLQREKDPQRAAIGNCILRNEDIKNKLSCITGLLERNRRPQSYLEDNDYFDMYPDIFITNPSRSKNFSQDYLDIKDLLRTSGDSTKKRKVILKIVNPEHISSFESNNLRRFNKLVNKNILRSVSASGSDSSDSDDTRKRILYSSESSSEEKTRKEKEKKKAKVSSNSVMYMQSPSRIYEARRRLPHFLPKRYHWNEDDLKELRNYWFNGPQGKYWGLHKTPY